jgi:hypothetical protein
MYDDISPFAEEDLFVPPAALPSLLLPDLGPIPTLDLSRLSIYPRADFFARLNHKNGNTSDAGERR